MITTPLQKEQPIFYGRHFSGIFRSKEGTQELPFFYQHVLASAIVSAVVAGIVWTS